MEKFECPEDPWSYVVGGSLPLGRISHWFQEKGQIKSTSEDRNIEKKSPCCVPGGTPVGHPEDRKGLCPQPETGMGSFSGPSSTGWKNQMPSSVWVGQKNPHPLQPDLLQI